MDSSFFKTKDGKQAIAQWPNLPLWIWLAATIANKLIDRPAWDRSLAITSFIAIVTWASLEILEGDSPFRRVLGTVVLLAVAIGYLS